MSRDADYIQMIHTQRWLTLRKDKLTRQPLCERCQEKGIITAATEVHHRTPVETSLTAIEKRLLMFDPHNLMSLCHPCHAEIHKEMRSHSREAVKSRERTKLQDFRRRFLE